MLSAECYFRGNYLKSESVAQLLGRICAQAELVPDYWNIHEPIDIPFSRDNSARLIAALVPSSPEIISTLVFLVRKRHPGYLLTLNLWLAPVQWTTAHSSISIEFEREWYGGETKLAQFVSTSVLPKYPDYAKVVDTSKEHPDRLNEFRRPYTPQQFSQFFVNRPITLPFGPYGCLEDVYWFNYFGKVYVDFIGQARLKAAGWAHVEEIGDGLACYATDNIDDSDTRGRRLRIANSLEEFVWTPGCKSEDKKIPIFDYSEQLADLPAEIIEKINRSNCAPRVLFSGFSEEEQAQAIRSLERAGATYYQETKTIKKDDT